MTNVGNIYEHFKLWDDKLWEDRQSKLLPLATWLGEHDPDHSTESTNFPRIPVGVKHEGLPYYRAKTQAIEDPAILDALEERGLWVKVLEMGRMHWISTVPTGLERGKGKKFPVLLVFHHDDPADPNWAMRTLEYYDAYHRMAVEEGWIVLYVVAASPDYVGMYGNVLQEAFVLYPCDPDRLFLDVNAVCEFSQVDEYRYTDLEGNAKDPDTCIESFGSDQVPILDISRRWENLDSINRNLIMNYPMNKNGFELEKVLHSATGRRMANGFYIEHTFRNITDPDYAAYWLAQGLKVGIHRTKGERWVVYAPSSATLGQLEKLPVVIIMQEVNDSNEHLPIKGVSCFYEYQEIAANGDAILLYFALEDLNANDLLCEILDEAEKLYPIDRSRVYITGHSHNGFFSIAFARRHPELITAVATLGNPLGIMEPGESGESVFAMNEEQVASLSKVDMPVINIMGCHEWNGGPDNSIEVRNWQRRLRAARCPMKTEAEIVACAGSDDKAERILGVPVDKSDTQYMDGFEHYIGDVMNSDGAYHLRLVKIEGLPHVTTPFMQHLSWAFMRRFRRDAATSVIVELC